MTDRPLISVIVPACNHERFIDAALRSLIAQTYPHLELVVLDDGSTDHTFARITSLKPELERRFIRVKMGTQANEGSCVTISRCLERAQSDLVYMLDSDDCAYPNAIESLLPLMAAPDVAVAVGDNEYIDETGAPAFRERDGHRCSSLLDFFTRPLADFSLEHDFGSYRSLIQGNYVPNGWLLRRAAVIDVGGYAAGFALDDWPLLLQLSKKYRIQFAGQVLAKYRLHQGNTFTSLGERLSFDTAKVLLKERAYSRRHGFEAEWWKHAHRVFEKLNGDQIQQLAQYSTAGQNSRDDSIASLEDLVQLTRRETDLLQVKWDLNVANVHRQQLEQSLEDAAERLRRAESEHTSDRDRLTLERDQLTLQQARLSRDLAEHSRQLESIESSRTWRWSKPLRAAVGALERPQRRRWEACLDAATADSESLGGLVVTGWAFHRDSPVLRVDLSVQGRDVVRAEYGIERPDVVAAFPSTNVGHPGFKASVHVLEDPVTMEIAIVCANGRTERTHRRLNRPRALNARAREIYGAPESASLIERIRALMSHGRIGRYIWESGRIRGWIRGNGEASALAAASNSLRGSPVIVEIGTFLGCSTVLLAGPRKQRGTGRVHCIDLFSVAGDDPAMPVYRAIAGSLGMPIRQAFEQNMRRAGLSDWITVHEMESHEAARQWQIPIDMLYLDGDVSAAGSRQIFLDWSHFLRRGGILAINGAVERVSGIESQKVVEEFVRPPAFENIRQIDHITFAWRASEDQ